MAIKIYFIAHTPSEMAAGIWGGTEDINIDLPKAEPYDKENLGEIVERWLGLVADYADLPVSAIEIHKVKATNTLKGIDIEWE